MYSNTLQAGTRIWSVEKYQRLNDIRCNPVIIEKRGSNELAIHVNINLKMLSVVSNGMKMEEFCFSPLVYSHEVICKDARVLFTTRSQRDGSSNGKFRVRFRSTDYCQSFCSFLSSFLNITTYEDLQKRDSQSNMNFPSQSQMNFASQGQMNLSMSTSEAMNNSFTLNNSFSQTQTDTAPSTLSASGGLYGNVTPQHMMSGGYAASQGGDYIPSQSCGFSASQGAAFSTSQGARFSANQGGGLSASQMPMSTSGMNSMMSGAFGGFNSSTVPVTPTHRMSRPATPTPVMDDCPQSAETTGESEPNDSTSTQAPMINVHVSNLISDKAMTEFTSMMETFFERLFALLEAKNAAPQQYFYPIFSQPSSSKQQAPLKSSCKRTTAITTKTSMDCSLPEYMKRFSANAVSNSQKQTATSSSAKNPTKTKQARKSKSSTPSKSLNLSRSEMENSFDLTPAKTRRITSYGLRGAPPTMEQSPPNGGHNRDYLDDQIFWD